MPEYADHGPPTIPPANFDGGWSISALQVYCEQLIFAIRDRMAAYEVRHADLHDRAQSRTDEQIATLVEQVRREHTIQQDALNRSLAASDTANEKRFDQFAAFRDEVNHTSATLISRQELSAMVSLLTEKITSMTSRLDRIEGKSSGITSLWAALLAGSGAVAAVVSLIVFIARARGG